MEQEDKQDRKMVGEERTYSGFREDLDRFLVPEAEDSVFSDKLSVGPAGDGRSQTQQDGDMEAVSVENGETECGDGVEVDEQTGEEELQRELDVCLLPIERSGGHVRISLEEAQRYYSFSRCCHWLCGTFDTLSCSRLLFILVYQEASLCDVSLLIWLILCF